MRKNFGYTSFIRLPQPSCQLCVKEITFDPTMELRLRNSIVSLQASSADSSYSRDYW